MSVEVLLIVILAFGLIVTLRARQRLALLADQIRMLRAHALDPVTYRPAVNPPLADALASPTAEAEALGYVMLGDYVEEGAYVPDDRFMRWFVDPAGTTFGWMAPFVADGAQHTLVVLMSHELKTQTITTRQPPASMLSRPPFVTVQQVAPAVSFAETCKRHRSRAGLDDEGRAFVPVRTFDQVRLEIDRMRMMSIDWRRSQPAEELLDADLKSLLGAQYDRLAGAMRRRLR